MRKLLLFAHTPPPHHGQSFMVQQVLQGLGGDARGLSRSQLEGREIACYHVNCRLSRGLENVGRFEWLKPFLLIRYCFEAIWCRFRYGVTDLFMVPASPNRSAIYRDWIIHLLCGLFFKRWIMYWQAAGFGEWLETCATPMERRLSLALLSRPALSIVLAASGRLDAEALKSDRIEVIPNFIGDPCPNYAVQVRPERLARMAVLEDTPDHPRAGPGEPAARPRLLRVLFMSLCTRTKGLFDTVEAVALANRQLSVEGAPFRFHLDVAGGFCDEQERQEFEQRIRQPDLLLAPLPDSGREPEALVCHRGFVQGEAKQRLFLNADCFCFPTYYPAESVPLALIEAMAYGLPVVTTRWRHVPGLFPEGYPGITDIRSPDKIADRLLFFARQQTAPDLRQWFETHYLAEHCLARLKSVLANR